MMTTQSSTQYTCDTQVKNIIKSFHSKCCNKKYRKKAFMISGNDLNSYLKLYRNIHTPPFTKSNKLNYHICNNMLRLMMDCDKSKKDPQPPTIPVLVSSNAKKKKIVSNNSKEDETTEGNLLSPNMERLRRLKSRTGQLITDKDLSANLKVTVVVGGTLIDETPIQMEKPSQSTKTLYKDNILGIYYKVPFGRLTMKERRLRMIKMSKMILSSCIDRNEYKTHSHSYLESNTNLAVDILNLIDGIKECIERQLKLKLDDFQDEVSTPIHDDRDGVISELDEKKESHRIAIELLGTTGSGNKYKRARNILADTISLPSKYILNKNRPDIEGLQVNIMSPVDKTENEGMDLIAEIEYDDVYHPDTDPIQVKTNEDETELQVALRRCSTEQVTMDATIISGKYNKWIELLEEKHKKSGRILKPDEKVIVLDSIDGAEHLRSRKKITSVISFSTSILTAKWLNKKEVSAGSSLNILTWQQMRGSESLYTIMPAVKDYFESRKLVRDDSHPETSRQNFYYHDLHDGKMLYLLTQHSLWNRKYHPFVLCKCTCEVGVKDPNHACIVISNSEQLKLWDKSKRRWNVKRNQFSIAGKDPNLFYNYKSHMDWIDEKNLGVSHFGIHPSLMPFDGIRFDTFHMKCAVTRKLMTYVRNFILQQSNDCIELFQSRILSKIFNTYHLYCWRNKKSFSSFSGNELAIFVGHTTKIIEFIKEQLVVTPKVDDISKALQLWHDIFHFLGLSFIKEGEEAEYENRLVEFNIRLKLFYSCGGRTFLSKPGRIGSQETFYTHALRFYIPRIAKITYDRHGVGVGIFTMQGFERRNKESKQCLSQSCNYRNNILPNNLGNLYDIFANSHD